MALTLLGLGCLVYTCAEIARAWGGRPAAFGAVDLATGRALAVTFDRRTRERRTTGR